MNSLTNLARYWVSGEDSRPGRQTNWIQSYLSGKGKKTRFVLELSKVVFVLALSANIVAGMTRVL